MRLKLRPILIIVTMVVHIITPNCKPSELIFKSQSNLFLGTEAIDRLDVTCFAPVRALRLGYALLGGSWVVISGVISPLVWVIIIVT